MAKKSNKSTTKNLKGEIAMAKQAQTATTVAQETKKGETTMDLRSQVSAILKRLPVAEKATTSKGSAYNILKLDGSDAAEEFRPLWREHKEAIKALGVVVFPKAGEYFIRDFTALNYDCSKKAKDERSRKNLEKAREVSLKNRVAKKNEAEIAKAIVLLKEAGLLK